MPSTANIYLHTQLQHIQRITHYALYKFTTYLLTYLLTSAPLYQHVGKQTRAVWREIQERLLPSSSLGHVALPDTGWGTSASCWGRTALDLHTVDKSPSGTTPDRQTDKQMWKHTYRQRQTDRHGWSTDWSISQLINQTGICLEQPSSNRATSIYAASQS